MATIDINLSSFLDAEIEYREVDGQDVECISIPIQKNGFTKVYGRVWAHFSERPNTNENAKYSSYLAVRIKDKKYYQELVDLGWWKLLSKVGYCYAQRRKAGSKRKKINKNIINDAFERD